MRTWILFGLLLVAMSSNNNNLPALRGLGHVIGVLLIMGFIMDMAEFIKKMGQEDN